MTLPTRGIRHIALFVRDMETMARFYRDVLGYRDEWNPSPNELYMTTGADNLALHKATTNEDRKESRLDHFGILLREPSDVDAWAAHLRAHHVPLDTEPRTHRDGARSFYARDPEGNRIQFLWHPPISGSTL